MQQGQEILLASLQSDKIESSGSASGEHNGRIGRFVGMPVNVASGTYRDSYCFKIIQAQVVDQPYTESKQERYNENLCVSPAYVQFF